MAKESVRPIFFVEELGEKVRAASPRREVGFVRFNVLGAESWPGVWIRIPNLTLARQFLRKLLGATMRIASEHDFVYDEEITLRLSEKPEWLDFVVYNPEQKKLELWVKDGYRMKRDREHIVQTNGSLRVYIEDISWLSTTPEERVTLMRERGRQLTGGLVSHMQANNHRYSFELDGEDAIIVSEITWDDEVRKYPLAQEAELSAVKSLENTLPRFLFEEAIQAYWNGFREGFRETETRLREVLSAFKKFEPVVKEAERAGEARAAQLKEEMADNMLPVGFAWIIFDPGQAFTEAFVKAKDMYADPHTSDIWKRGMIVSSPYRSLVLTENIAQAMADVFQRHGIACWVHTQWD